MLRVGRTRVLMSKLQDDFLNWDIASILNIPSLE